MSRCSPREIAYLKCQPLAIIGTPSNSGRQDVAAVSFDADGEYVYFSGRDVMNTMKYKNVLENPRASFVVDNLKMMKPWASHGIQLQGKADIVKHTGYIEPGTYIRIKPVLKRSWNIQQLRPRPSILESVLPRLVHVRPVTG